MQNIDAQELKSMMRSDEELLLVNVLDQDAFERERIPGSLNVPNSAVDFVWQMEDLSKSKHHRIVVYCASKDCDASPDAARKLEQAGFANIMHFKGGMAEWKAAGNQVETGKVEARR